MLSLLTPALPENDDIGAALKEGRRQELSLDVSPNRSYAFRMC